MRRGSFFAEFTLISGLDAPNCERASGPLIGITHVDYNPKPSSELYNSKLAWTFSPNSGRLHYGSGRSYSGHVAEWPGKPYGRDRDGNAGNTTSCEKGDKIGLLLDLDSGTLAIYRNQQRLGVIVPAGLKGPLRWTVGVGNGCGAPEDQSVSIEGKAPPTVSEEQLAKDLKEWKDPLHQNANRTHYIETRTNLIQHSRGEWSDDY